MQHVIRSTYGLLLLFSLACLRLSLEQDDNFAEHQGGARINAGCSANASRHLVSCVDCQVCKSDLTKRRVVHAWLRAAPSPCR